MSEGFVDAEVQAAAVGRHNRAKYAGAEDVSLAPYDMTLQNASRAQFIPGQGCSLHLQVLVQGPKGKASVGEDIEASVLGVKEAMVRVGCLLGWLAGVGQGLAGWPGWALSLPLRCLVECV
jgi:hypothetical protein